MKDHFGHFTGDSGQNDEIPEAVVIRPSESEVDRYTQLRFITGYVPGSEKNLTKKRDCKLMDMPNEESTSEYTIKPVTNKTFTTTPLK